MRAYVIAFTFSYCFLQAVAILVLSGLCQFNSTFVKEGTMVSCICQDNDPKVDKVFWSSSNPEITAGTSPGLRISSLVKNFTRKYNNATIECKSSNNETTHNISNIIQIAYGPDRVSMTFEPSSKEVNVCPTCHDVIVVNCQSFNSYPSEVTSIYMNGVIVANSNKTNITRIDKGGLINITCRSNNTATQTLFATHSEIFTAREAPTSAPNMTIDGSSTTPASVTEGVHEIVCRVDGGYPLVENVTVQCGSNAPFTMPDNLTISYNFTEELNQSNCSCWASHVTGFYHQRKDILINVLYPPRIITFTVNGTTSPITVSEDRTVNVSCEAVGNPEPDLKVVRSSGILVLPVHVSPLTFELKLQYIGTDNFTCEGNNAMNQSARSVPLSITCVAEPKSTPGVADNSPSKTTVIIVATVVPVAVLAVILTVVAVVIYRRRSPSKEPTFTDQHNPSVSTHPNNEPVLANQPNISVPTHPNNEPVLANQPNISVPTHPKYEPDLANQPNTSVSTQPNFGPALSDPHSPSDPPYNNISATGISLSGVYDPVRTGSQQSDHIYDNFINNPTVREASSTSTSQSHYANLSTNTSQPQYANILPPEGPSTSRSDLSSVNTLPATPNSQQDAGNEGRHSETDDSQPPEIPEKTNRKIRVPSKSKFNRYNFPEIPGQKRSPRAGPKPPQIPAKPSAVHANLTPMLVEKKRND